MKVKINFLRLCVLITGSLLLGILFDCFFSEHFLGISFFIYILLYYLLFYCLFIDIINRKSYFGLFLHIPVLLLSLAFSIFNNPVFQKINILLVPILLFIQCVILTDAIKIKWHRPLFAFFVFKKAGFFLSNLFAPLRELYLHFFDNTSSQKKKLPLARIVKVLVLGIPLLFLVINLLVSADQIFKTYVKEFTDLFGFFTIEAFISHTVVILFAFMGLQAFFWAIYRLHYGVEKDEDEKYQKRLDSILSVFLLISLNAVYLFFVIIQFVYLFGGEENIIAKGLTYSQYAVKGFWELMFICVINIILILSSALNSHQRKEMTNLVIKGASTLLIAQSYIMLVSSHLRLSLYENMYGYTYQRLFAHTIILLLAVLLALALIKIWRGSFIYIRGFAIACLVLYMGLNFMGADSWIAVKNIELFGRTGRLDSFYLANLSVDANDVIRNFLTKNAGMIKIDSDTESVLRQKLSDDLNQCAKKDAWFEWNYGCQKILIKLQGK